MENTDEPLRWECAALLCTGPLEPVVVYAPPAEPPQPPPPPAEPLPLKPCIVCEDLEIFGSADDPPSEPAVLGSLRCWRHTRQCVSCRQQTITNPLFNNCASCAERMNLCIACISIHRVYGELDPVLLADYPSRRCHQHKGWCAACLEYSVETEEDDCCAKCKRENLRPAYTRASVDIGDLERTRSLCRHFWSAMSCNDCYCRCFSCTNRYGYAHPPRRLPAPPPPLPPALSLPPLFLSRAEELLRAAGAAIPQEEVQALLARLRELPAPTLCVWPGTAPAAPETD
jgi:hypothetical protein